MATTPGPWIETIRVKTYETDFQNRWKPAHIFQALQQSAAQHAASLGFHAGDMLKDDLVWVLSRVRLRLHALPGVDDTVRIETWPKGLQQRLLFMRDFLLTAADGSALAEATSGWLLVNPRTRRILPPDSLPGRLPDNGGRSAISEALEKLNPPDGLPQRLVVTAGYSAIDLMGHVTNARYLEWVADAFSLEEHAAHRLTGLQINYTSEIKPGEQVVILAGPDGAQPRRWWVQGLHQAGGARAFEAVLEMS